MSEEEPELKGLPPPRPFCVEGGVWEEAKRVEELQSFRTGEGARGNVHEVWVSVQVLPRVEWGALLQIISGVTDFFWRRESKQVNLGLCDPEIIICMSACDLLHLLSMWNMYIHGLMD